MQHRLFFIPLTTLTILSGPAYAKVFLTLQQAQALLCPGATLRPDFRTLTGQQVKAIEKASGVRVRNKDVKFWRASTGGWFIADEVVGKHEFIPFAVALDSQGAVKGIEILEYREAYGGQVQNAKWRSQFIGKQPGEKLKLDKNIRNISGATLSCRHITDGVARLLAIYAIVFRGSTH